MNTVNQIITIDLLRPSAEIIHAKQDDALTRTLTILLKANGIAYEPGENVLFAVQYRKSDGKRGLYTKLPDGETDAVIASGSTLTVNFAEQVFTVAGRVSCSISMFTEEGQRIQTFSFVIDVEASETPGGAVSEDYFNYPSLKNLSDAIGSLSTLDTSNKKSLVAAINELHKRLPGTIVGSVNGVTPNATGELSIAAEHINAQIQALNQFQGTVQEALNLIVESVVLGAIDVTPLYTTALAAGTAKSARAYLWTLPAGRYYLYDEKNSTRYHLHAMAGELADGSVVSRLLYVIDEFCNIEFYGGGSVNDPTAVPTFMIEGEDGAISVNGEPLTAIGTSSDASEGIYVGEGEMPEGAVLQIDPSGEVPEMVTRDEFEQAIKEINTNLGAVEAELEALL